MAKQNATNDELRQEIAMLRIQLQQRKKTEKTALARSATFQNLYRRAIDAIRAGGKTKERNELYNKRCRNAGRYSFIPNELETVLQQFEFIRDLRRKMEKREETGIIEAQNVWGFGPKDILVAGCEYQSTICLKLYSLQVYTVYNLIGNWILQSIKHKSFVNNCPKLLLKQKNSSTVTNHINQ